MSKLSDIEAALEARAEAAALLVTDDDGNRAFHRYCNANGDLQALLTDDTIAALVAVAEAADVFIVCNEGGEPISWLDIKAALAPLVKEADHE